MELLSFIQNTQLHLSQTQLTDWQGIFGISTAWAARTCRQQPGRGEGDVEHSGRAIPTLCPTEWGSCCRSWSAHLDARFRDSQQSCPNFLIVFSTTRNPHSSSGWSCLPGLSPSIDTIFKDRRVSLPTSTNLQWICSPWPGVPAAPQLLLSLSTVTILVNQRRSLLLWFDRKFSHFLPNRVRVTHTQPTPRASCTAARYLMRKGTLAGISQ